MPVRGRLTVLAALLAGIGLVACGTESDDTAAGAPATTAPTTAAESATTATADPPTTTEGGEPAPTDPVAVPEFLDFVAPDVRGGQVTGAELAGQDLVLWFWAPW